MRVKIRIHNLQYEALEFALIVIPRLIDVAVRLGGLLAQCILAMLQSANGSCHHGQYGSSDSLTVLVSRRVFHGGLPCSVFSVVVQDVWGWASYVSPVQMWRELLGVHLYR